MSTYATLSIIFSCVAIALSCLSIYITWKNWR